MNRNHLEITLTKLGYSNTGKIAENDDVTNKSVYYEWFNGQTTLYVGSWFIETDNKGYMFPWADKKSTIEELKTYIND